MTSLPFSAGPIRSHRGRGVAVIGADIDTDRIIPARFLKCVTFEDLAAGAFADDRSERQGDHPFDRPQHQGASVLVVNSNFGCGSSREHAPQALMRWGIRVVIGESFAEIFFGNCLALGIPCLRADPESVAALQQAIAAEPDAELQVDVEDLSLQIDSPGSGQRRWALQLDPGPHRMLVSGQWDGTSQLVSQHEALQRTAAALPYLNDFVFAP